MFKKLSKLKMFVLLVLATAMFFTGCSNNNAKKDDVTEAEKTEAVTEAEKTEETKEETEEAKDDEKAGEGGVFVRALTKEPQGYNPNAAPDNAAYQIHQNISNKLLKINGNDQVVPDIAESWEFSEDGKVLTFKLHEAKWHDGEDFTADDVKWTFDTILAEEGFASASLEDITEVNVIDDRTVEFVLEQPNAGILGSIAWQGTYIMPEHIYAGTDWLTNEANQNPIGTGPFKFVEHKPGESITLTRNDDFFGDVAKLDEVKYVIMPDGATAYQAWLNGEIDDGGSIPEEEKDGLRDNPDYIEIEKSWPNKSYFCFNVKEGKFADPLVREAVLYGIDLDDIFNRAYKGVGKNQEYFIPWQYDWALNEDVKSPERDIEKAKSLLEQAGYEADADGYYFETTLDTFPGWDETFPIFQSQFKEFGIKLNHNSMDDATYDKKVLEDQDFELTCLGGYIGPDISSISNRIGTDGFMNYGLYSSEEMDALLEEGLRTTDEAERAVPYQKIQELLRKDLPVVYFRDMFATDFLKSYVKDHPSTEGVRDKCSESEYTYLWLDK